MSKFAKTFDTEFGQLLVMVGEVEGSDGNEGPGMTVRLEDVNGLTPAITYGPWQDLPANHEHVEMLLEQFDQESADNNARLLHGVATSMTQEGDPSEGFSPDQL